MRRKETRLKYDGKYSGKYSLPEPLRRCRFRREQRTDRPVREVPRRRQQEPLRGPSDGRSAPGRNRSSAAAAAGSTATAATEDRRSQAADWMLTVHGQKTSPMNEPISAAV